MEHSCCRRWLPAGGVELELELELEGGDAHYSSQLADKEAPGGGAEQQVVISQSQFGGETDHSSHTACQPPGALGFIC